MANNLADKILEAINGGLYLYDELQAWAESEGYAPHSFIQVMSNLRTEGVIEQHCGGVYPADSDDDSWDVAL